MNRDPSDRVRAAAHFYPAVEERLNIASHALGLGLSLLGLVLLLIKAWPSGDITVLISAGVFGLSMVALYAASTAYHSQRDATKRTRLRIVDHATIYLLIAGTYTPFSLLALKGATGWWIFGISWAMATVGVVLRLFYTGHFDRLSTAMYVFMGWLIVFAIEPLVQNLSTPGLYLLFGGGISYTFGAILYSIKALPYNHALFHLFVLGGTICHFLVVYWYLV